MKTKVFSVDWDSLEEVTKAFNSCKSRYFELKRQMDGGPSKKVRSRQVVDACLAIMDTDISNIYGGLELDPERKYYVYAHLDPSHKIAIGYRPVTTFAATLGMDYFPFYVGKGTGDRYLDLNRSETHRKIVQKIKRLGFIPKILKIRDGLTEGEALEIESKLIDIFGLISCSGYLANLDEGYSPERRRALYSGAYMSIRKINGAMASGVL